MSQVMYQFGDLEWTAEEQDDGSSSAMWLAPGFWRWQRNRKQRREACEAVWRVADEIAAAAEERCRALGMHMM